MEAVEQLSLVLVDPLDMDVKDGGRVDLDVVVLLDVLGQLHFVFLVTKMKTTVIAQQSDTRTCMKIQVGCTVF